jgi:hypothetical protein
VLIGWERMSGFLARGIFPVFVGSVVHGLNTISCQVIQECTKQQCGCGNFLLHLWTDPAISVEDVDAECTIALLHWLAWAIFNHLFINNLYGTMRTWQPFSKLPCQESYSHASFLGIHHLHVHRHE